MKQVIFLLTLTSFLIAATNSRSSSTGFKSWGVGGGIALAVPEDGYSFYDGYYNYYYDYYGNPVWTGYDDYWWGATGVGFAAELKGTFRFQVGKAGYIHYVPNLGWWGRSEDVNYRYSTYNDDIHMYDQKISINISDARYVPPVPSDFPLKPYIGFGLLGFEIYSWSEENTRTGRKLDDTEFKVHQTFLMGGEVELSGSFWPYFEFKFQNGNVHDFQMFAGFTIQGRK